MAVVAAMAVCKIKIVKYLSVLVILMTIFNYALASTETSAKINSKEKKLSEEERKRLEKIQQHKKLLKRIVQHTEEIPGLLTSKKISPQEIPNPHWKKDNCISCHAQTAGKASRDNLRNKTSDSSCSHCHIRELDHNYIHPVDIRPSRTRISTIKTSMRQEINKTGGKVTCSTCHDISLQCKMENTQRHENPLFLRAGPYSHRYDLCTQCHQEDSYQRFNPHEHVNDRGEIIEAKCITCHDGEIEVLKNAKNIDQVSFHIKTDLNEMCWGCHKWKPHPGGSFNFFKSGKAPNHLVKPSDEIVERINKTLKEKNVLMPLEPETGKVFCATCHNPHAKNVIKNIAAAKGAESKSKLRSKKVCNNCHIM